MTRAFTTHLPAALVVAALMLLATGRTADAAPPPVPLFADSDLGDALTHAVQTLGADPPHIEVVRSASVAACSHAPGPTPRLALLAREPMRPELDRCSEISGSEVSVAPMGRQAVALVVPATSPVWSLDTDAVFRAFGEHAGETPLVWNALNPAYPKLRIGLLLPPPNSLTTHLFDRLILEPGCNRVADARAPFDKNDRQSYCDALRGDVELPQRQDGAPDVANWATAAAPGQVAVVSIGELRQLDRVVVPLLLDGALPTAANIASGQYPAAANVSLMIVVPNTADAAQRAAARKMAFELLAEASIGPDGNLAPAGLIALTPTERIAARSQAVASLEPP